MTPHAGSTRSVWGATGSRMYLPGTVAAPVLCVVCGMDRCGLAAFEAVWEQWVLGVPCTKRVSLAT